MNASVLVAEDLGPAFSTTAVNTISVLVVGHVGERDNVRIFKTSPLDAQAENRRAQQARHTRLRVPDLLMDPLFGKDAEP